MTNLPLLCVLAVSSVLAGCAVGPDYVRPHVDAPPAYKESGPWKTAEPKEVDSHGNWWERYGDAQLDALMNQANAANQNIRQAEAQYRQARAAVQVARSAFFPTVGADVSVTRSRTNSNGIVIGNGHSALLDTSWEPDVWGRVRRSVEAGDAGVQAGAADLAAARLTIQADLAQDYFQIRIIDAEKALYAQTIAAYKKSLQLTQSQFVAGIVTRADVGQAQTQLKLAQAQAIDLDVQRNQLEHAVAILLGKMPSEFTLLSTPLVAKLPVIPTGLPSDLLERRPDIAGAERRAAAANANIGVAKAAYFPALSLTASAGDASGSFAQWFSAPSRVWSLGATLAQTIFDGGLRKAQTSQAEAAYDVAVSEYKQTVLNGFQEVEDDLATLRVLDQEATVQDEAVRAAHDTVQVTLSQYRAGTTTYLTVATAQANELTSQRTAAQLLGRQFVASVGLIKAIGGGWQAAQIDPALLDTAAADTARQNK